MFTAIEQAAHQGYEVVVFTGGEPTLAGESLLLAIKKASCLGMKVRMVTNAHWAKTDDLAGTFISELIDCGLVEINFSTGDQHARFVPIENLIHATRNSVEAGLNVAIMIETVKERNITRDFLESRPDFQQILEDFPAAIIKIHESPWMPLSPRNIQEYEDGIAANNKNLSLFRGCDSILSTTTIQADGVIGACCGLGMRLIPELNIGRIGENTIAEAEMIASEDFLKRWIRIEGPEKILAWAATQDTSIEWENMYAHRCQACIRIYKDPKVKKVIKECHQLEMANVLFSEWLLYHYPGAEVEQEISAITW